ncbi:MAG: pantetheine-phosphate adenylyltransferase [Chloroflexota bacterium]
MTRRALYAATFDPVHNGHLDLMYRAAAIFDELIVGVYDHNKPTKSIVFPADERVDMIQQSLDSKYTNIKVMKYGGLTVEFSRQTKSQVMVRGMRVFSDFEFEFRLALANQRLAPEIETINFMTAQNHTFLSGTTVREIASLGGDVSSMVPEVVAEALYRRFNGEAGDSYNRPVPLRD